MARLYTLTLSASISTTADFFALSPAADKPIRIHKLLLSQKTDVGDAQEEELRFSIRYFKGATITAGTGGAAQTPNPVNENDAAAGFTARVGDTTIATTTGTNQLNEDWSWNSRSGPYERVWVNTDVDERPRAATTANKMYVRLEAAPAAARQFECTLWVVED